MYAEAIVIPNNPYAFTPLTHLRPERDRTLGESSETALKPFIDRIIAQFFDRNDRDFEQHA